MPFSNAVPVCLSLQNGSLFPGPAKYSSTASMTHSLLPNFLPQMLVFRFGNRQVSGDMSFLQKYFITALTSTVNISFQYIHSKCIRPRTTWLTIPHKKHLRRCFLCPQTIPENLPPPPPPTHHPDIPPPNEKNVLMDINLPPS